MLIAPFHDFTDFNMSLTNKFYDAMSNGKPFITCLSGAITKVMNENNDLEKYHANCAT